MELDGDLEGKSEEKIEEWLHSAFKRILTEAGAEEGREGEWTISLGGESVEQVAAALARTGRWSRSDKDRRLN